MHAASKHRFLAFLRVIALDDANSAQRLREAPNDFRSDFAAFAEDGPDRAEGFRQSEGKAQQESQSDRVIAGLMRSSSTSAIAEVRSPPAKSTKPVPKQVAHAFHIAHDARNQRARLIRVVKRDRQARNVFLHLLAQFRDQPLRLL